MSGALLPPVPNFQLTEPHLGDSLRPSPPSLGVPGLDVPSPIYTPPALTTPLPGLGGPLPPNLLSPSPTAPPWLGLPGVGAAGGSNPLGFLSDFVDRLGNGPGLQADRDGVGTTQGDWRLRFMPYVPFLNEP